MNGKRWSDGKDRSPVFMYRYTGDMRLIDDGDVLPVMYNGTVTVCASHGADALVKLAKHFDIVSGELYRGHGKQTVHISSVRNGILRWLEPTRV